MSPRAQARWPRVRLFLRMQAALYQRVAIPFLILVVIFVAGTLGYALVGFLYGKPWTLLDCAFMTSITLTTVGYGDPLGATEFAEGRLYTMTLLVAGMGATLYSVSSLTAFIVEGHLGKMFRERRMEAQIASLSGHTIICGAGRTGVHVVDEHIATRAPFLVIDKTEAAILALQKGKRTFPYLLGDATDADVLTRAGLSRAGALVACLSTDPENLFLLVTARALQRDLRVIVKALEHDSVAKFMAAGATRVVSPTFIGGMRIASEVLRPQVVSFLDNMLRAKGTARVSEAVVERGSELCGKTLHEARLDERIGLFVVAIRGVSDDEFSFSPGPQVRLEAGTVIIVIGPNERVTKLEALASRDRSPHPLHMSS